MPISSVAGAIANHGARVVNVARIVLGGMALPALLMAGAAFLAVRFYLYVKTAFFDDSFIYLQIAKNAVDFHTFQYFPLADRSALLASSPARLIVLTAATWCAQLMGYSERTLDTARFTLAVSGVLTYLAFVPFWRAALRPYLWIGVVFFLLAGRLDTVLEFEGGLLLLWTTTLVMSVYRQAGRPRQIAALLPLGALIRPDLSLCVYVVVLAMLWRRDLLRWQDMRHYALAFVTAFITWSAVATLMGVYPLPVTYWAKAVDPHTSEKVFLLQVLFDRIGSTLLHAWPLSGQISTLCGYFVMLLAIMIGMGRRQSSFAEVLSVGLVAGLLFSRMPGSFWWYYHNIIVLVIALAICAVIYSHDAVRKVVAAVLLAVVGLAMSASYLRKGELPWDFGTESRTQGYLYLAEHATGRGTYNIPSLGEVIIKSPEIGIIAYFSGHGGWIWDSAGLAQPAVDRGVLKSSLRHLYPKRLWDSPQQDAARVFHSAFPVYEMWAMDDRNFAAARAKCSVVIEDAGLAANLFSTGVHAPPGASGIAAFGRSSPGCAGSLAIAATAVPRVGNTSFALTCSNAPPNASGLLALAGSSFPVPIPLLGAELWVDPSDTCFATFDVRSNARGACDFALPIPNQPWLANKRLAAQFLWVGPTAPLPCPPLGLSASNALAITIQP